MRKTEEKRCHLHIYTRKGIKAQYEQQQQYSCDKVCVKLRGLESSQYQNKNETSES